VFLASTHALNFVLSFQSAHISYGNVVLNPFRLHSRGVALFHQRRWPDAIRDFTACIAANATCWKAYVRLGETHSRRGEHTKGLDVLRPLLAHDVSFPNACFVAGRVSLAGNAIALVTLICVLCILRARKSHDQYATLHNTNTLQCEAQRAARGLRDVGGDMDALENALGAAEVAELKRQVGIAFFRFVFTCVVLFMRRRFALVCIAFTPLTTIAFLHFFRVLQRKRARRLRDNKSDSPSRRAMSRQATSSPKLNPKKLSGAKMNSMPPSSSSSPSSSATKLSSLSMLTSSSSSSSSKKKPGHLHSLTAADSFSLGVPAHGLGLRRLSRRINEGGNNDDDDDDDNVVTDTRTAAQRARDEKREKDRDAWWKLYVV
jgi:hypothetical protein